MEYFCIKIHTCIFGHYVLFPSQMIKLPPRVLYPKMFVGQAFWNGQLQEVGQSFWDGGSTYYHRIIRFITHELVPLFVIYAIELYHGWYNFVYCVFDLFSFIWMSERWWQKMIKLQMYLKWWKVKKLGLNLSILKHDID